ncbi:Replication factor C [Trema orientale]|uniref:Replication factor C n=1 Tax=Trema orientale TaxID=63057 RepID=A0A2P5DL42_TREOI|nr:Replication factor C [Trema orientale]
MQTSPRYGRASQFHSSAALSKQRRSGYEPSDTETDFQESPWRDHHPEKVELVSEGQRLEFDLRARNTSPLKTSRRHSSRYEFGGSSPRKDPADSSSARRRHSSKSPYKTSRREDSNALSPLKVPNYNGNITPQSKPQLGTYLSPYEHALEEHNHDKDEVGYPYRKQTKIVEVSRVSKKPNYSKRSVTAPGLRPREKDQQNNYDPTLEKKERTVSPLSKGVVNQKPREAPQAKVVASSIGEINERAANAKLARDPTRNTAIFESTDSISPGDIFFSREWTVLALPKNGGLGNHFIPKPKTVSQRANNNTVDHNKASSGTGLSQTTTIFSTSASRQGSGRFSTESSKLSDVSTKTTESMKKFTANRRKSQKEAWFGCMKKGPCRSSKSPERTAESAFNETLFIEKAFVVEKLGQFWADKHQPGSLNGFISHKQEAQLLKQLVSDDTCPHILLKGPTGSGKKALAMALLHEIYGDASSNVSYDLRYFQIQENRPMQVVVPITSSAHHLELNVHLESNAKYALLGLVREIIKDYTVTPEISTANLTANYKVIVLYDVDKAADESIQHLIKWIMDCYTDTCKLVLCCEDDTDIIESVKNQCKVIKVDAPATHEIMEVLIQIARKEEFDLPVGFAAKIAIKSKQNLRRAIMALEACRAHKYPFVDNQPIPLGWEDVLVEISAKILANPSPNTLYLIRGRFQKLLVDFVHPKLILQKLVEEFLKGIDASIKRELYYWHAYYEKKLPTGPSALLKLEEFVAKFMSIHRRSSNINRQIM